jgi:hypothetical protein
VLVCGTVEQLAHISSNPRESAGIGQVIVAHRGLPLLTRQDADVRMELSGVNAL